MLIGLVIYYLSRPLSSVPSPDVSQTVA
jgi:hypothetical protein